MAGDLSRLDQRTTAQDRVTNNRSGVLPSRRNTEAPDRKVFADMRTARRGDVGGAEELLRIFGGIRKAGESFSEYATERQAVADRENAAEGQLDAVTGERDDALAERSRAYRVSFEKGRAEKDVLVRIQGLEEKLQARLSDPENKADMDDVDELIHSDLKEFLARDFGSPEAKEIALAHLRTATHAARANAFKVIQEQVNEEALTDRDEVLRLRLERGEAVTFEEQMEGLPPTVDRRKAKDRFVQTVKNYAESIKTSDPVRSLQVIDQLLGSKRGSAVTPVDLPASDADPQPSFGGETTGRVKAAGTAGEVAAGLSGLPDVVIAGFLGNIEHESRFRHQGAVGDGGTAFGLAQWRAERVANFRKVIGVDIRKATVEQQVRFIKWEMDNPRAAGMTVKQRDRILSATTPEEAARYIDQFYERSNGKSRREREEAARRYFDEHGVPSVPGQEMAPAPASSTELAERSTGPQVVSPLTGTYSLNPDERAQLMEFRQRLSAEIKVEEDKRIKVKQEGNADLLLTRFLGNGSYPTYSEVRELVRTGEIGAEHGWQAFNIIKGDENEARAEARQARAEALEATREARERRTQDRIAGLLAPVYTGQRSVSQTAAGLLGAASSISDPEERQAVIGAVRAELNAIEDLRERSPGLVTAMDSFDRLEKQMIANLPRRLRGERREKAVADIKSEVNRQRVFIGRATKDRGYDAVKGYQQAERALTDSYLRAYGD